MPPHITQPFNHHYPQLEDFWLRRDRQHDAVQTFRLCGLPLRVQANEPAVFDAVRRALSAFSAAPAIDAPAFSLQIIVRAASWQPGPPQRDLYPTNLFAGDGEWLMIQMGAWGHAHVDLGQRRATVVLTPELAGEPDIVARGVLHTIFTNLLIGSGFAMLHCTGLRHGDHVVLLMAPHNSGKSTTALRLTLNGFQLLSDSQIYVSPFHKDVTIMGFPVGRARLRRDMLPHFPQLHDFLQPEAVRGETKFSFDLREFDRALVHETAMKVQTVDLCLLTRGNSAETTLNPATTGQVWDTVIQNSIFYDSKAAWQRNLAAAAPLIDRARPFNLQIGHDAEALVRCVKTLLQN